MTQCVFTTGAVVWTLRLFAPKKVSNILHYTILLFHVGVQIFFQIFESFPVPVARGDTFAETEDVTDNTTTVSPTTLTPTFSLVTPNTPVASEAGVVPPKGPTEASDPQAAPCSGRPFDAFLQLKNGSIYAFRGKTQHSKYR